MGAQTWYRIRLALMTVNFIGGLAFPPEQGRAWDALPRDLKLIFAILAVAALLLFPVMLLFVIGIQAVNPLSDNVWTEPTHQSNPLRLGNPLLFFHFGAYVIGAQGLGMLISSLWKGLTATLEGLLLIAGAVMCLVGVRLSMRVFRHKMAPQQICTGPTERDVVPTDERQ